MLTGGLIPSVFVFALVLGAHVPVAPAVHACPSAPPGWDRFRSDRSTAVNVLALYGQQTSPTWNGTSVTATDVREYLGITKQMTPQPILILLVSPTADCSEVDAYRRLADETLKCGSGRCVEVDL